MQENLEPIFTEEKRRGSDSTVNVEKLLSKLAAYWPLFVAFVLASCIVAYVYLRYATPRYMVNARVLVKDQQKGAGEGHLLQELGMQGSATNVENEVELFKSRVLMAKAVGALQSNIHYYAPGRIKTSEYYYKDLPFRFVLLDNNIAIRYKYKLQPGVDGYKLSDKKRSWDAQWGDTLDLPSGRAVLVDRRQAANPAYNFEEVTVEIKATEYQAIKNLRKLKVKPVSKSTILELSISDVLPQRGEDLLDRLAYEYMQENIDDRNKTMEATVDFINERLVGVSNELTGIEKDIERFKSTNQLTDLSEQSKMLLDYSSEYEKQLTDKEVKLKVIESLERYLQNNENKDRVISSSLLSEDAAATSAIKTYNELQLKRSSLLISNSEESPYVKNIERQLANIREDLMLSLASMKQGIRISIAELEKKVGSIDSRIRQVPENERVYLEYSRQQNIKQELYLFLLKKREETEISKSSTVANASIVDPAKREGVPYSPQPGKIYFTAIAIGLILPGMWVFAREMFNLKVNSKEQVRELTQMSIAGEISNNASGEEVVVQKDSKTVIAEQFRTLRTNMQFLLADDEQKIILLTSSMSGEGKSFVAMNLAVTLALSGKRIVLMELDLRKPKISASLKLGDNIGFTEYVVGKAEKSEILHGSGIIDTLKVVPSGSIPPNPSELLMSPKVNELFVSLKKEFDYIVVDSAPVGLVTDAQLLSKLVDTVLYVVRMNYTHKEQLRSADELYKNGKLPHTSLILNDVKSKGGVYGYSYGYGSNSGDYYDNNSGSGIRYKIKKIIKRT